MMRLSLPLAATAAGILCAGPALADVTVTPATAVQGTGENLTFHVTNTGTEPIGTVSLRLPEDTPVAEAYPLSVDDWAPKTEMRTLSTPLPTIHGDTTATQTASAITWLAMPGRALAPGKSADLSVAIGPLPDLSTMRFTVVTTYVNGKNGPDMPPATLTLTPDTTGQAAAAHAGHDAAAAPDAATGDDFGEYISDATRGPSVWSVAGWVVAAFALLGGVLMVLRSRHRSAAPEEDEPEPTDDEPAEETQEPVAAGKWSLRG